LPEPLIRTGLFLALLLAPVAADAQQTQQDLDNAREQKAVEEDRARSAKENAATLRRQLKQQSASLAELAGDIREGESQLSRLDHDQAAAEARIAAIEADLVAGRDSIARALSALAGVSDTPPLAVIARPGKVLESRLQAAALAGLTPALEAQMTRLRESLENLQRERTELAALKSQAASTLTDVRAKQAKLSDRIARKRDLARSSETEARAARKRAEALAQEVKTLTALMQRLDDLKPVAAPAVAAAPTSFAALKGRMPLPAEIAPGGEPEFGDDAARMKTRGGAIVTAPHDAIVRFAGPFRSYEGLLILDFGDGYHLLVAGLSGIDVVVGQWLLAGEPVGRMPGGLTGAAVELYLELRHDGSVIDPAPWLAKRQGRSSG
jgi:septal ring factor EnvC (AmiA/AmiB activator)